MRATRIVIALSAFLGAAAIAAEPSATPSTTTSEAKFEFDHIWIVVTRDAPERSALERAGLKIAPEVNRHDGQGTASITAEFQNSYLELMWPDPTVSVAPGAEKGVEKFNNRMNWRTSGWCPIGIGLHRAGPSAPLPFPTWTIAPAWMPKGNFIEILTARDDTKSPSFFIEPEVLAVKEKSQAAKAADHPSGVKRITAIRIVRPKEYQPVPAFTYLEKAGIFKSRIGNEWSDGDERHVRSSREGSGRAQREADERHWAVEVTFDGGQKGLTGDLRPELPLVLYY